MSLALLTAIIAGSSVLLFALWYVRSRNTMEARVRALGEQQKLVVEYQDPFTQRVAFPVVDGIVRFIAAILPTSLIARSQKWLVIAGDKMTLSQFLTIVLITATALPGIFFVFAWIATDGSIDFRLWLVILLIAAIGFFLPFWMLRRSARNRQKIIWRSLPGAMDLMTTCVESGLSLDYAMQRVAERYHGPLADELNRALREIGLGKTRREALIDMADRVDLPDLHIFVNSIVQAEQLGTSIGQVLRTQAQGLRLRRRQRAEQIARQAPVKMIFPMVFCFIPALFIVIIGPVVLNAINSFD